MRIRHLENDGREGKRMKNRREKGKEDNRKGGKEGILVETMENRKKGKLQIKNAHVLKRKRRCVT